MGKHKSTKTVGLTVPADFRFNSPAVMMLVDGLFEHVWNNGGAEIMKAYEHWEDAKEMIETWHPPKRLEGISH